MDQKEELFLVHNNFCKREIYLRVLDKRGNLTLRYSATGNTVIKYKLANVTKMSYGDFQDKIYQSDFCQRDG